MIQLNSIYNEDCYIGLDRFDNHSIHLLLSSPPYNVDLGNNKYKKKGYDTYDDNMLYGDYLDWLQSIYEKAYTKLTRDGRVVINIGDGKNGSIPTHADIICMMQEIGYHILTTIVWDKGDTSNRAAWGSYLSPASPSFPKPFEFVLIFYTEERKLQRQGKTDIAKEDFINWSYGLWKFPGETQKMKTYDHPAMFPEELPKRCIQMLTYPNDIVVDLFSGIGTTCVVAELLNRQWVGFEISEDYCERAEQRLALYENQLL